MLPFGNRTVILTLTGAKLQEAFTNGFPPSATRPISTGRFPQISGLKVQFHCGGAVARDRRDVEGAERAGGTLTPIGPADTVRFVTNDFMYTGGDGYTAFAAGTDVASPGTT